MITMMRTWAITKSLGSKWFSREPNHMSDGLVHMRTEEKHVKKCEAKYESMSEAEHENKNEAANQGTHHDISF
jgi:hypothetical protein